MRIRKTAFCTLFCLALILVLSSINHSEAYYEGAFNCWNCGAHNTRTPENHCFICGYNHCENCGACRCGVDSVNAEWIKKDDVKKSFIGIVVIVSNVGLFIFIRYMYPSARTKQKRYERDKQALTLSNESTRISPPTQPIETSSYYNERRAEQIRNRQIEKEIAEARIEEQTRKQKFEEQERERKEKEKIKNMEVNIYRLSKGSILVHKKFGKMKVVETDGKTITVNTPDGVKRFIIGTELVKFLNDIIV